MADGQTRVASALAATAPAVDYAKEATVLTIDLILLILAFVCFILAACNVSSRVGLVPLGLAFFILTMLI